MNRVSLARHGWLLGAAFTVLAIYVFSLRSMPTHVFLSPDEGSKLIHVHSIQWKEGSLRFEIPYPGAWLDPQRILCPLSVGGTFLYPAQRPDGTLRFHWPPWFPLASKPGELAFGINGIYLLPLLSGWLITLAAGWLISFWNPALAPMAILTVGLATPVFFYSVSFWEHTTATLFALLATVALVTARRRRWSTLLRAAPLLLASTMLRLELLAFAIAAVVALVVSDRVQARWNQLKGGAPLAPQEQRPQSVRWRAPEFALAALVLVLCFLFAINLTPRHLQFLERAPGLLHQVASDKLLHLPRSLLEILVTTPRSQGAYLPPPWGILALAAIGLCSVAAFVRRTWLEALLVLPALLALLGISLSVLFSGQPYRSLHGIFLIAPYLVVGFYALPEAWRERQPVLLTIACLASFHLVFGIATIIVYYVHPDGSLRTGLEWGQRYMLTVYPLLAVLSLTAVRSYWRSARPQWLIASFSMLFGALLIVAAFYQVRGFEMQRHHRRVLATWDRVLRQDGPVVTDVDWLPAGLTDLFLTKEMFLVRRYDLPHFADLARQAGVKSFVFASQHPLRADHLVWIREARLTARPYRVLGLQVVQFEFSSAADGPASLR